MKCWSNINLHVVDKDNNILVSCDNNDDANFWRGYYDFKGINCRIITTPRLDKLKK